MDRNEAIDALKAVEQGDRPCSCAHNNDGSVTTMLCSVHSDEDPCHPPARVTGRRRRGSIIKGVCTSCGWSATTEKEN